MNAHNINRGPQTKNIELTMTAALTALIKGLGLREGVWHIGLRFGPVAGIQADINGAGPVPAGVLPVAAIVLARAPDDAPLSPLVLDAGVVNPPSGIVLARQMPGSSN